MKLSRKEIGETAKQMGLNISYRMGDLTVYGETNCISFGMDGVYSKNEINRIFTEFKMTGTFLTQNDNYSKQ